MVLLWIPCQQGAHRRALQGGVFSAGILVGVLDRAPVQHGIQLMLNVRPGQQRKLRVIHAQMHAHIGCGRTGAEEGQRHVEQRIDIGHADQAEADLFTGHCVDAMVLRILVQAPCALQHELGKFGASLLLLDAHFENW